MMENGLIFQNTTIGNYLVMTERPARLDIIRK